MIDLFYAALALIFAAVITYMVVYNMRHKTLKETQRIQNPAKQRAK
jgi:hypothetical protein